MVEAITEGQQLVDTTEKFLSKNKELLSQEEIDQTNKAISDLKNVLNSEMKDLIQQKTENLNEVSRPFAERVMNEAIKISLKGKII